MSEMYQLIINVRSDEEDYQEEVYVHITDHAWRRMDQRLINEHGIYSSILALGEELLDLKCNEEFVIIDKPNEEALVCSMECDDGRIITNVITVIDTNYVYVKEGQTIKVLN